MLQELKISGMRGIREGHLTGLAPLTILVGPNGSGKSTVLDALLIGSGVIIGDAVGRSVNRRSMNAHSSRDFFSAQGNSASIEVNGESFQRICDLSWQDILEPRVLERLERYGRRPPFRQITCKANTATEKQISWTGFGEDNRYVFDYDQTRIDSLPARLIDTTGHLPLDKIYSELVKNGKRREMKKILQGVIPWLEDMELLTDENPEPSLYLFNKKEEAIPLALAGDGIVTFARLAFTLMTRQEKLLLVEEPEIHQHPACIGHTAKLLLDAVREGTQIVATTHSLELIDYLLIHAVKDDLKNMALIKCVLDDGVLFNSLLRGEDIRFQRDTIEEDLR